MQNRALHLALVVAALALPASLLSQERAKTVTCVDGSTSKAGKDACSQHGGVASPGESKPVVIGHHKPSGTVTCKDGTTAKRGKGACSHHGGIAAANAETTREKPGVRQKSKTPTGATALCKDGTYSRARYQHGACAKHGGVDKWLKEVPK
jgi:Protein of unknown function (DUF3761)